mmetsp:Transcript_27226/g.40315  ORF Transcript_27226/g.40315 Transcript_27226/m.40315 type:complete len:553 (+) Transcript_27226:89-1747(+)
MPEATHGLAGSIRSSKENETFDFGGLSVSTMTTVMQHAFGEPFTMDSDDEMIRITLVTGAGKQARQKYDPQALKVVTSTLISLGFQEDRGASCVKECAGMYKVQHDTGKNLKTVVVFPKIQDISSGAEGGSSSSVASLLPRNSMLHKIAASSLPVFQNMVQAKCHSWSQKKALMELIQEYILSQLDECESLLMGGKPLSPAQQEFYDECTSLAEKQAHVKQTMHLDVENGNLTEMELEILKDLNANRITELKKAGGKSTQKALERQEMLNSVEPHPLPKLKHYAALSRLWKQVAPLMHLNEGGQLLSVHDTKLLGQKMELLEQIGELEEACQGWLEDDAIFEVRVKAYRREMQSKYGNLTIGKKTKSKSQSLNNRTASYSAAARNNSSAIKWITPQEQSKKEFRAKNRTKSKNVDVFSAMMAGDDSDEDESDEEVTQVELESSASTKVVQHTTSPTMKPEQANLKKKKNKNRKKKKKNVDQVDNDDAFAEIDAELKARRKIELKEKKEIEEKANVSTTALSFVQSHILPLIVSFLTWLIAIIFGKPRKKKTG